MAAIFHRKVLAPFSVRRIQFVYDVHSSVDALTKTFGQTRALDGVDLRIATGTVYGLLGPNGAGKTTLVRILATLVRPDAGTAVVAGHDLVSDADGVRRSIGLTGQYAAVDDVLTGEENLLMMARLRKLSAPARGVAPPSCSRSSTWSTRPGAGPAPTRAA